MVEGRDGEQEPLIDSARPGETEEQVALALDVPYAEVLCVLIIRHLVKISACGKSQAQLVYRRSVVDQRSEATEALALVMQHLGGRRFQPVVPPAAIDARIISEATTMT